MRARLLKSVAVLGWLAGAIVAFLMFDTDPYDRAPTFLAAIAWPLVLIFGALGFVAMLVIDAVVLFVAGAFGLVEASRLVLSAALSPVGLRGSHIDTPKPWEFAWFVLQHPLTWVDGPKTA